MRPRVPRRLALLLLVLEGLARVFDASLAIRRARRGPWRAEVADDSMTPGLRPGDWLLLDPTCARWPRPGSIVVVREPETEILAIKRVAARGARSGPGPAVAPSLGDAAPVEPDRLAPREAWLLGDSADGSIDSRTYGPLDADALVARAWFRYGPPGRIGRLR